MATETAHQRLIVRETHERLSQYGAQSLSVVELVAIVLGTGATKEAFTVAENLLIQSGGLHGVARLGLRELEALDGMGAAKARQLRAALELGRRLVVSAPDQRPHIKTPADAAQLFMVEMGLLEQEEVHTLLLDVRNRVMGTTMVYRGSLNSTSMRAGEVFRDAVRNNCSSVIVAHNHPSGDPTPSAEDICVTKALVAAGKLLDVELLDHIIVSQGRYVSLKERGLGFDASS
jgi:DNA repair protein RadC